MKNMKNYFDIYVLDDDENFSFAISKDSKISINYSDSSLFFSLKNIDSSYDTNFTKKITEFIDINSIHFDWYEIEEYNQNYQFI